VCAKTSSDTVTEKIILQKIGQIVHGHANSKTRSQNLTYHTEHDTGHTSPGDWAALRGEWRAWVGGDGSLKERLVQVEGVPPAVHKHRSRGTACMKSTKCGGRMGKCTNELAP